MPDGESRLNSKQEKLKWRSLSLPGPQVLEKVHPVHLQRLRGKVEAEYKHREAGHGAHAFIMSVGKVPGTSWNMGRLVNTNQKEQGFGKI